MKRVTGKVSALTLERDGNKIKASYKVPSWMSDTSRDDHACWIDHEVRLDRLNSSYKPIRTTGMYVGAWNGPDITRTGADRYWIRGQERSSTVEKNYDRTWFHPLKLHVYCNKVVWGAFGGNSVVGDGWGASMKNIGPIVWAQRTIGLPRKPAISWEYDQENSKATVTIKTDEGKDWNERYDTMYQVTVRKADGKEATLRKWTASRATEITAVFDLSPYLGRNMAIGKYITIKCQAYARGMAGDNPSPASPVTSTRSVYWPSAATIGAISCSSKTQTGRVTVSVTPGKAFASTTQLQLERATSTDKNWNGVVPEGNWTAVSGATDNGDCTALYDTYADANPQPGVYTFYRVRSERDQYHQYSAAKRADCMFTAKPKYNCSATVGIVSVTPTSSGDAAVVVMGWSDGTQNYGWELSWSDNKGAWNSTEGPSKMDYDPQSGMAEHDATSASKKYKQTKTLRLDGLTPGTTYYVRMRRKREVDSTTYYSAYATVFSFTTESARDDRCGIISMTPWTNGTACTVVVGYTEDNVNQLTELSWSTSSGAWSSNSIDPEYDTFPTGGVDSPTKWKKQVSLTISELTSGTTYHVRARRCMTEDHTTTGTIVSYTPYSEMQSFRTESAADDKCGIISIEPGTTGTTAKVVVGFKEDNQNTGTELQWSTDSAAWQSNVPPESLNATWPRKEYAGSNWTYYQNIYLRNLTPGKTYYAYARRYLEAGGNTTHTPWSKRATFKTPRVTAANDKCGIVSVTRHSDNTGANVVVGWTEDTANDGTELTWSTDKDAWTSNQQPNSLQATWSDENSRDENWKKTQVISLHGLERGETYYIKARRYRDDDEGETFSPYATMVSITLPTEKTDEDVRCGLVSVTGQSDGTSAVVVVGWDGDHTGCEVTWSTDPNAWESSEPPQSLQFDWQDASSKSDDWSHTSTCYIRSLEEGQTYYVKARSYFEHDGTVWSEYSGDMSVTPFAAPASVTLTAPDAVARGKSIECWWAIDSEMEQTEWHMHEEGQPNKSIASGTGSLCHASISADKYDSMDSISFYVDASTGGEMTSSNVVSVGIAEYPSCEAACIGTLTVQPVSFEAYSDNDAASLLCTLRADGVTIAAPDGDRDQLTDDVVWTSRVTPTWAETTWGATVLYAQLSDAVDVAQDAYDEAQAAHESDPTDEDKALAAENAATALADAEADLAAHPSDEAVNMAEIEMPDMLEVWDGASYTLSVQAAEPVAGLVSDTAKCKFSVNWAHQAVTPAATLTVDSDKRSVSILLGTPNDAIGTDVCDVYRTAPAGHELVASGVPFGENVVDNLAPFGIDDLHYRICLRTTDGDFAFMDFPYVLKVGGIRFDWAGKYVELPWNVQLSESYSKDFETRSHVDGSTEGYFGPAVGMTGSFSTDLIKVDDTQLRLVRELGSYPGAVFCRTSAGTAFQCNVNVSELSMGYSSGAAAVGLDVTRVALTDQFKCQGGDMNGLEPDDDPHGHDDGGEG